MSRHWTFVKFLIYWQINEKRKKLVCDKIPIRYLVFWKIIYLNKVSSRNHITITKFLEVCVQLQTVERKASISWTIYFVKQLVFEQNSIMIGF